uniref:Uncharacterized protein n=1 Tax=Lactuca sativa TaxID=4236 RepID=A0A9R1X6C8_LACSA|nr:hypothetical protein LSAT_V11C600332410 [Lactuca sativa]
MRTTSGVTNTAYGCVCYIGLDWMGLDKLSRDIFDDVDEKGIYVFCTYEISIADPCPFLFYLFGWNKNCSFYPIGFRVSVRAPVQFTLNTVQPVMSCPFMGLKVKLSFFFWNH